MLRVTLFRDRQRLFEGTATHVVLPSEAGEVSVMDFHAPMLCALGEGVIQIDGTAFAVRHGLARVARNVVTMLVH